MAGSLRDPGKARQGAALQGKDPPALEDEPIFVSAPVTCPGCCEKIPKKPPSVSGWFCAQQGHLILAPRDTTRSPLSTSSPSAYKEQKKGGCTRSWQHSGKRSLPWDCSRCRKTCSNQTCSPLPWEPRRYTAWRTFQNLHPDSQTPVAHSPVSCSSILSPQTVTSTSHTSHRERQSTEWLLGMREAPANLREAWESFIQPRYSSAPRQRAESGQVSDASTCAPL